MKIEVKKISFFLGMQQNGQVIATTHTANENKKIYVLPGQYAIIEMTSPTGTRVITEMPIGPFGWEYTVDHTQHDIINNMN